MIRRFGVVVGLLLVGIGMTLAAEGRREISGQTALDGSVSDITGSYFVSRNITGTGTTPVIHVLGTGSENVEVDLNGFTLTNSPGSPGVIVAKDLASFTVRSGSLEIVSGNGIDVSGQLGVIDSLTVVDINMQGGAFGIYVTTVADLNIRQNTISDTSGSGIRIFAAIFDLFSGTVESNRVFRSGSHGIHVGGGSAGPEQLILRKNSVWSPAGSGIIVKNGRGVDASENVVNLAGAHGISLDSCTTSIITRNTIEGASAGFSGIALHLSQSALVSNNVSTTHFGGGSGILVSSSTLVQIDQNVFSYNHIGILFSGTSHHNTFGRNTLFSNVGTCPFPNMPSSECPAPDVCDETGDRNASFTDNIASSGGC